MKIQTKRFSLPHGEKVDLKQRATIVDAVHDLEDEYQQLLAEHVQHLSTLQQSCTPRTGMPPCSSSKAWMQRARTV